MPLSLKSFKGKACPDCSTLMRKVVSSDCCGVPKISWFCPKCAKEVC